MDPLLPGRWNFFAEKAGRRILIGIRPPDPLASDAARDRLKQHGHPAQDTGQHK